MSKYGKFSVGQVSSGDSAASGRSRETHKNEAQNETKSMPTPRRPGVDGAQKMKTAFALDTSDMELPNERGGKMGGGVTNLGHSLSGASAVQRRGR